MSIIGQNSYGWFICSKKYFDDIHSLCIDGDKRYKYKIRPEFFDINTPFLMNSAALKKAKRVQDIGLPNISIVQDIKKKKLKKKKKKLPIIFNSHVDSVVETASTSLIKLAHSIHYLDNSDISHEEWFQNNVEAREAAKMVTPLSVEQTIYHKNQYDSSVLASYFTEEYILPPQSTFYLSDVKDLHLVKDKFDLILLDPPWKNKSVRRKKGYYTMDLDSLLDLPIEKLCNPGCLIIVWVTNKKKQISFVEKELFQKWNITTSVIWHWVKVTKKGHYVFPMDSQHKKPYENLLLGYVDSKEEEMSHIQNLEPHKVIVSVPSSIHSQKPPLVEILQAYLPKHPHCLEIFARYLLPGWTSIGNEVIKLQNTKLFERFSND